MLCIRTDRADVFPVICRESLHPRHTSIFKQQLLLHCRALIFIELQVCLLQRPLSLTKHHMEFVWNISWGPYFQQKAVLRLSIRPGTQWLANSPLNIPWLNYSSVLLVWVAMSRFVLKSFHDKHSWAVRSSLPMWAVWKATKPLPFKWADQFWIPLTLQTND